jgi:hypothetical protein
MSRAADSDLEAGEYRITPAVSPSDVSLGSVLSGDAGAETSADGDGVYRYEVLGPDGATVLDVVETRGSADIGWLPFSLPQYVYVFVDPDGESRIVVEVDHALSPAYTIRASRSAPPMGSIGKSRRFFGNWQFTDRHGDVIASADRTEHSSNLVGSASTETWAVAGPDGAAVAEFQRVPAEGSSSDRVSAIDVTCSRSAVSTEQTLAFALALLNQGEKSTTRQDYGE